MNAYVANFFFISAFGLVVTAQWELSIGNGFAYTVFSAFGMPSPNDPGGMSPTHKLQASSTPATVPS